MAEPNWMDHVTIVSSQAQIELPITEHKPHIKYLVTSSCMHLHILCSPIHTVCICTAGPSSFYFVLKVLENFTKQLTHETDGLIFSPATDVSFTIIIINENYNFFLCSPTYLVGAMSY